MPKHAIRRYMTVSPVVVASDRTLAEALQTMREHRIRHLPVVDGGKLVGVVSQRDLYLLQSVRGVDMCSERVSEAMTPEPYAVDPDAPVAEVASVMAERKYGSALVVERGEVVGVFTTVDALRALGALLRRSRDAAER